MVRRRAALPAGLVGIGGIAYRGSRRKGGKTDSHSGLREPSLSAPTPELKRHATRVLKRLKELYPNPRCALNHENPYQLLVATILSAQCTDARVNLVTPALFARYPDPQALATADLSDVETVIHSTGFFRAKARNLIGMASAVVDRHGGEIPANLDDLTALPGVGRKTAHVVMGNAFGVASGVVVDTHVKRLAARLGLTTKTDPGVIELELAALTPRKEWINLSHRLIDHGRAVCGALRPDCPRCALQAICPRAGVVDKPAPPKTPRKPTLP
jgi:endonuclease-3